MLKYINSIQCRRVTSLFWAGTWSVLSKSSRFIENIWGLGHYICTTTWLNVLPILFMWVLNCILI